MRIAIDVDDVIVDLMPTWLAEYNRQSGETLMPNDMTQWDMSKLVKDSKMLYAILDTPIWNEAKPVRGAGMAVYKMLRADIDVIFVTAQYNKSKVEWLIKHGYIEAERDRRFVVASDKSLIDADALIDDKAENVIRFPAGGVIFARPWNDIKLWPTNVERLDNWEQIIKYMDIDGRIKSARV